MARRSFTLIELFVTIALIALVGSAVLFRAKPMLDHYRFNHSIERLRDEILLSKRIAHTAHADVEFSIEQKKDQLLCIRKTDEPLTLPRALNLPINIPYLHLEGKEKHLIIFTASGAILGGEPLTFSYGKKQQVLTLQ